MIALLYALWCGAVWRARGGALAKVTGENFGTLATRAACGVLIAVPLALMARDWWLLLIAPDVLVGLMEVGWAAFMAYSQDGNAHVTDSPFDWLPRSLGIPRRSQWTDAVGWLQIGPVCLLPCAVTLGWRGFAWWWVVPAALAFAPVYYVFDEMGFRGWLPDWKAVDTEEAWAELAMGVVIGAALALATGVWR